MKIALFVAICFVFALFGKSGQEDAPAYGIPLFVIGLLLIYAFWA